MLVPTADRAPLLPPAPTHTPPNHTHTQGRPSARKVIVAVPATLCGNWEKEVRRVRPLLFWLPAEAPAAAPSQGKTLSPALNPHPATLNPRRSGWAPSG